MQIRRWLAGLVVLATPMFSFADTFDGAVDVPEPETLALLAAGVMALMIARRRRGK